MFVDSTCPLAASMSANFCGLLLASISPSTFTSDWAVASVHTWPEKK